VNGVDKRFQEKQAAPEDISMQREELQQPLEDCQAKTTTNCKPEVENVRRMVEAAMLNADEGKMMVWKAEAEKRAVQKARAADVEARAEDAKCKAEAAELEAEAAMREAEAARVVMLEAATELERAAASEVKDTVRSTARGARDKADNAWKAAALAANRAKAANHTAQLWYT
jgi:colicin import membrane protein